MVRQTSLLKARLERKADEVPLPDVERVYDHGRRKEQSMFLQSEDLHRLFDALTRREDKPDSRREVSSASMPDTLSVRKPVDEAPEPMMLSFRQGLDEEAARAGAKTPEPVGSGNDALSRFRSETAMADTVYIESLDVLESIYSFEYSDHHAIVERLVTSAVRLIESARSSNALLRKAVRLKKALSSFAEHSLQVAILAIKIGLARGYSRERLFSIALCALLGDIGMVRLDPGILAKTEKLSSEELAEIKRHVVYTQEILEKDFPEFPFLLPITAQIHEREDGSGYPRGLRGENIHEFARIIGLCDVYIAMTTRKAHREDFSGYSTLQRIISRRNIDFSPAIIKSLIDVLSVFPLESLVRLNNGAVGRVIDISSKHPTRPKLSILINSDGERLETPKYLDLEQEPLLYVEMPDIEEGIIL